MNMPVMLLTLLVIVAQQPQEKSRQAIIWLHDGNILNGHVRGEVLVERGSEVTIEKFAGRKWKMVYQPTPNDSIAMIRFETPSIGIVIIPLKNMKRINILQPVD